MLTPHARFVQACLLASLSQCRQGPHEQDSHQSAPSLSPTAGLASVKPLVLLVSHSCQQVHITSVVSSEQSRHEACLPLLGHLISTMCQLRQMIYLILSIEDMVDMLTWLARGADKKTSLMPTLLIVHPHACTCPASQGSWEDCSRSQS